VQVLPVFVLACCTHSILAIATAISNLSNKLHFLLAAQSTNSFTIMSQCCLKSMLNLGMTISQTPVKPFVGAHYTVLNLHQQRLPCCPSVVNIVDCEKLYCSSSGSNFVF
jgi:hypothetical protein